MTMMMTTMMMMMRRYNDNPDDDDHQYGHAVVSASHLLRQSNRHLHGCLFRVRLHGASRVRCR